MDAASSEASSIILGVLPAQAMLQHYTAITSWVSRLQASRGSKYIEHLFTLPIMRVDERWALSEPTAIIDEYSVPHGLSFRTTLTVTLQPLIDSKKPWETTVSVGRSSVIIDIGSSRDEPFYHLKSLWNAARVELKRQTEDTLLGIGRRGLDRYLPGEHVIDLLLEALTTRGMQLCEDSVRLVTRRSSDSTLRQ